MEKSIREVKRKKKLSSEFVNMEKLFAEFQRGRECERRSIVARLKNKFETYIGVITFKEPVNDSYTVTLEDICNFILEGDK